MKIYLLVRGKQKNLYWYGYFKNTNFYWSDWGSLENVINDALYLEASKNDSFEEFVTHNTAPESKVQIILTSNKSITYKQIQDEYPELFI